MTLDTLPGWARRLLDEERVARLAYVDDNERPRVLPVTFALSGNAVWSAIDEKPKRPGEPARVRYLRRRPEAALVVDEYSDDWSRLAWVQLLGRVTVLPADEPLAADALAALAAKYEQYADRTPPGPLLRLDVERALQWRAAPP
ncbi:MAG TPA: pyridoxamine 5'-phosphate oxidase family protein [Thermoleophilaceae bacterium]|jgi:PPOX class probable F420-dependent enzyme